MGVGGGPKWFGMCVVLVVLSLLCGAIILCSLAASAAAAPSSNVLEPYTGFAGDTQKPSLPPRGTATGVAQAAALGARPMSPGTQSLLSTPAVTRYEETDPRLVYTGTPWTNVADVSASGGSYYFCNDAGFVTVKFDGTYLAWIAKVGRIFGEAQVTVDGGAPVVVDLYSTSATSQVSVWNTGELAPGNHTVVIWWIGEKNASSSDFAITVDAFDVAGSLFNAAAPGNGSISGQVTYPGGGIANIKVGVYDHNWNLVGSALSDTSGNYSITDLPNVPVCIGTVVSYGLIGQWYPNVVLPGNWTAVGATWLDLGATPSRTGINFQLASGSSISGKVTNSGSVALENVTVTAYGLDGTIFAQALTNPVSSGTSDAGTYVLDGLPAGQYHVATSNDQGYIDQWYKNVVFLDNPGAVGATALTLSSSGGNPNGINFSLATGRSISGKVTDSGGNALSNVAVAVYDLSGQYLTSYYPGYDGTYVVGGLPAGQYHLSTANDQGYVDQWYSNDPVLLDLHGTSAATIDLRTASATGKNFVVALGRKITGTVISSSSGIGLAGVEVRVQPTTGGIELTATTDATGAYVIGGLVPGSYVVNTANDQGYVDKWYDNDVAPADVSGTGAKPVDVSAADAPGINFALDRGYTISGDVKDNATGKALATYPEQVRIYNSAGVLYAYNWVGTKYGTYYATWALPSGSYYARTYRAGGLYSDKWYGGLRCSSYDLGSATPVNITGADATGINFGLDRLIRTEQTDTAHIVYSPPPTWATFPTSSASGGSYARANTNGSWVDIYFNGISLDWIGMMGTTTGKADVYLDGVFDRTVDLAASVATYQVRVWSTGPLPRGPHQVELRWNPSNLAGKYITLDAVEVDGSIAYAPPTITSVSPASGAVAGGTSVTIKGTGFSGLSGAPAVTFGGVNATSYAVNSATQITAVAPAGAVGTVDVVVTTPAGPSAPSSTDKFTYVGAPTVTAVSPATGPSTGATGVIITGTGFSGLSGASAVTFGGVNAARYTVNSLTQIMAIAPPHAAGAVDVIVKAVGGTSTTTSADEFTYVAAPVVTRQEQTASSLVWTGTWTLGSSTSYSGGSIRYIGAAGSVTIPFTGTYLAWIATTSSSYGIAKVTLDGLTVYTVDLYSSATVYKKMVWNTGILTSGPHLVKIEWTGTKNSASTGTTIAMDAADIGGSLVTMTKYEQNYQITAGTNAIAYAPSGAWATFSTTGASGGSYMRANTSGSQATIKFNGIRLDWIATRGTTLEKGDVYLDGKLVATINLAASAVAYQQDVWTTGFLSPGVHTVVIKWNTTNTAGKYVSLDAAEIWGVIQQAP